MKAFDKTICLRVIGDDFMMFHVKTLGQISNNLVDKMSSLVRVQDINDSMSTYKFLINEFGCFLAGSGRNGSCLWPSSKIVYSGDDVFIPLSGFRKRFNEI